jgi:hypothetical protein
MGRIIKDFKDFNDALADEQQQSSLLSPRERILLLHKLIAAWIKFPRLINPPDDGIPVVKRIKTNAR